ncbi:hypothetical protein JOB18_008194 [Solea senegalensis]|uniref:Uncharacterized protein n=1 Tax=Solea senegalensis TaxID=28829 RepID=A0AAV6SYU0_SOLSE|nr:hypothetical protein JOB18_008194 [Solea senegalensis]
MHKLVSNSQDSFHIFKGAREETPSWFGNTFKKKKLDVQPIKEKSVGFCYIRPDKSRTRQRGRTAHFPPCSISHKLPFMEFLWKPLIAISAAARSGPVSACHHIESSYMKNSHSMQTLVDPVF